VTTVALSLSLSSDNNTFCAQKNKKLQLYSTINFLHVSLRRVTYNLDMLRSYTMGTISRPTEKEMNRKGTRKDERKSYRVGTT